MSSRRRPLARSWRDIAVSDQCVSVSSTSRAPSNTLTRNGAPSSRYRVMSKSVRYVAKARSRKQGCVTEARKIPSGASNRRISERFATHTSSLVQHIQTPLLVTTSNAASGRRDADAMTSTLACGEDAASAVISGERSYVTTRSTGRAAQARAKAPSPPP
jgi:hypothetical protein